VERALTPGGRLVVEYADKASAPTADLRAWQFVQAERSMFYDGPHLQLDERIFDAESGAEVSRLFVVPSDGHVQEFAKCRQYYAEDAVREMLKNAHLEPVAVAPGSAPGLKKISAKKV